ncbi:MAG: hypothetical protein IID42_09315 [Planctomycetes bacterium]|nr:hypothetical protein [Planctomycetota bacterium]
MEPLLACGPYFREDGLVLSALIFLGLKPVAYFAFIQAFRYRVARAVPMRTAQLIRLVALRAIVGIVLIGGGAVLVALAAGGRYLAASWVYLYGARLLAWWAIGRFAAGIRGKRLVAWTLFGTLINIGFDVAVVFGLFSGPIVPYIVFGGIAALIWILHRLGRRASLVSRFLDSPFCQACEYNLTGNLSGICPECGTKIEVGP